MGRCYTEGPDAIKSSWTMRRTWRIAREWGDNCTVQKRVEEDEGDENISEHDLEMILLAVCSYYLSSKFTPSHG